MYNLKAQELFVPRTVEIYPMVLEKKNLQTFTDGRTKSYHADKKKNRSLFLFRLAKK